MKKEWVKAALILALQLHFALGSESIGPHDSGGHGWSEHRLRRRLGFGHPSLLLRRTACTAREKSKPRSEVLRRPLRSMHARRGSCERASSIQEIRRIIIKLA